MPPLPPTILETALKLHDRGLWIVACNGKGPIWPAWQNERRTREELAAALDGTKLNIGIVLNRSEWIDVECDTDAAESQLQLLFDGSIPPTPTWQSKRGKHRLFRRPTGLPAKATLEIEGIEFHIGNGRGANCIVPPSIHPSGIRYKWLPRLSLDDVEPAALPAEVVARLQVVTIIEASDDSIPEGKRNETLFAKGRALRDLKLPEEAIAAALLAVNAAFCRPPLPETEVRAIAHSVVTATAEAKQGFIARLLRDIDLWHDQNDDPFATVPQAEHRENWLIGKRCRPFRRWLSKLFFERTGEMLGASDLADLCALLEGKAVYEGPSYTLFRRVAGHEGRFYLDLCDEEWRAIEIDEKGWRVVSNPPVKFRRAKAMQALPLPVATRGTLLRDLLKPFVNVKPEQWPLVAVWLAHALRPQGPYPLLKLHGEQGSAKTTLARVLRSLIDPNAAPVRAEQRETRDLMIAANNGWVLCLDNLSTVKPALSDALCRLSTGGGFATRTLYSDDEETIFDAMRPVIVTSIEEIGTRSDLLERSLIIELPQIRQKDRRAEKAFWAAFQQAYPGILGALLDVVSGAIRRLPEIERKSHPSLPRLADFFVWGQAAEVPLGLEVGTFTEAFEANLSAATQIVLESSPLVVALLRYLKKHRKVELTASRLLDELGWVDELKRAPGWPKTARVLSAILKRAAPNLRQVGIVAVQDTRGGGNDKEKVWQICGPSTPAPAQRKVAGSQGRKGSKKLPKVFRSR